VLSQLLDYIVLNRMMIWKGCGRNQVWPVVPRRKMKTMKHFYHDSSSALRVKPRTSWIWSRSVNHSAISVSSKLACL